MRRRGLVVAEGREEGGNYGGGETMVQNAREVKRGIRKRKEVFKEGRLTCLVREPYPSGRPPGMTTGTHLPREGGRGGRGGQVVNRREKYGERGVRQTILTANCLCVQNVDVLAE